MPKGGKPPANQKSKEQTNHQLHQRQEMIPAWARFEDHLDAQKRPVTHPDHDETTLYIPPEAFKKLTPAMRQYWEIKRVNYEKLILFEIGGWYEVNYHDAFICKKILDINWMGLKPKIGIPARRSFGDRFFTKLVDAGYKVVLVREIEGYDEKMERINKLKEEKKYTKFDGCTKRAICDIKTPATFCNLKTVQYQSRHLLVV